MEFFHAGGEIEAAGGFVAGTEFSAGEGPDSLWERFRPRGSPLGPSPHLVDTCSSTVLPHDMNSAWGETEVVGVFCC